MTETPHYDRGLLMRAIVERAATILVNRLLDNSSSTETLSAEVTAVAALPEANGKSRRKQPTKHTPPRTVSDEAILELIRQRGPLRVVEIQEATGLTQSSAHKKIATLREANSVKLVKEGTIVRYAIPPRRTRNTASD